MSKKGVPRLNSVALLQGWEASDLDDGRAYEALRETALSELPQPIAESLQKASAWFMALHLDRGRPFPKFRGSVVKNRLRGVMLDLRHTARVLAALTLELTDTSLDHANPNLSLFTNGLANRIERLANEIEDRISPTKQRTPPAG